MFVWIQKNLTSQATEEIEIKIKKILLPIDGSSASLRAARYAVKIAKQENAEIICIHAIANLHYPPGFGRFSTISQTFYIEGKKLAEHWFLNAKTLAAKEGVKLTTDIIIDVTSVVETIIQYAMKEKVDLIVMGTRGRTGLKTLLVGSIANGVVLYAHCSVFVVR